MDGQRATDAKTEGAATGPAKFRSFMIRHRVTIQDLSVLFAIMLVAAFVAFEFDIYENQDSVSVRERPSNWTKRSLWEEYSALGC